MNALRLVAEQVGVSERTLRRAVSEGTLYAIRPTPRTLEMSVSELDYVRRKWPLLAALRARLRTEPNVRFAVLFGSTAGDQDTPGSDVDLLVQLRDPGFERLLDLGSKLEGGIGRHVDLIELCDAESDSAFLARIVAEGRVLVDRDRRWPQLRASEERLRRRGSRREAARVRSALAGIDRLLASC
jgi:predicted nucleotidyltransferase